MLPVLFKLLICPRTLILLSVNNSHLFDKGRLNNSNSVNVKVIVQVKFKVNVMV